MTNIMGWLATNENRSCFDKFKQAVLCKNGHDNKYNYLNYKSGKQSDFHNRAVCKRCKHLQLYAIPSFVWDMLDKG